jgi:hypothetical protein
VERINFMIAVISEETGYLGSILFSSGAYDRGVVKGKLKESGRRRKKEIE